MMEWWNDLRMLVARYLVASEQIERSGPVAAAVRAAGYLSEDEDEEAGSSVEEEQDDVGGPSSEDHHHAHHDEDAAPPQYTHPSKHSGIEIGPNGYALEKKADPNHDAAVLGEPGPDSGAATNGANVVRKPSKRQQEKAPEGQAPRLHPDAQLEASTSHDGQGMAPKESKFIEVV